jgi:hypothetical protein
MDEIIEDLIDKMNKTSYDDTVILGTLLILLESNKDAYQNFFKEEGKKIEITEDTNIFIDVASDILNKIRVEQNFEFKDFKANYNNLPQITDIMNNSDDPEKTQTNFEQNFVNLAQVFYEMQFCGDKLVTSDTNIQNIMVIVENMLLTKPKSLQVTYYNNKRLLNDDRIKQEEFANIANVDFGRAATLRDLKKRVSVPTDSTIKHQIVVLDDPEIGVDKIEELVDLCNIYTVFILVNIPGFEHEKEIVRIVSITFSTAPPKEPLIEGGARNKKTIKLVATCSDVNNVITGQKLAIGRHIETSKLNVIFIHLQKILNVNMQKIAQCLKELKYMVIDEENEKKFKPVLLLLKSLFEKKPDSINLITYDDYQELVKTMEDTKSKSGGKTKLDNCLNELGYKFEETKPDTTGTALVATPPDASVDEYCDKVEENMAADENGRYYSYTDILKDFPDVDRLSKCEVLVRQGFLSENCVKVLQEITKNGYAFGKYIMRDNYDTLLKKMNNNKDELDNCLESLGFELAKEPDLETEKSSNGPIGTDSSTKSSTDPTEQKSNFCDEVYTKLNTKKYHTIKEIQEDFSDSNKFFECLPGLDYSEDCVKVYKKIIDSNWVGGEYIYTNEYDELLKIPNMDEEKLNECLKKLDFKLTAHDDEQFVEALATIKNKYNIPYDSQLLTRDQYDELLKNIFSTKAPTERDKTAVYNLLTYILDYKIKEPDTAVPAVGIPGPPDAANTGSIDATNTESSIIASTDAANTGSSIDASTASTPPMSTPPASTPPMSTPPVSTPPDPLKNKFGMYHGCSYKGYEFQAEIKSKEQHTEVTYTVKEDLDTIVRYLIFSNIVVFIVN